VTAELDAAPRPGAEAVRAPRAGRAGPRWLAGRLARSPDWLIALLVGALAVVLAAVPQWRGTFFYYVGDEHDQFAPLWHVFGMQLRAGHWPVMDPSGWMGGNYAAEGLDGIWNPVSLANYVLVSHVDDLSRAAFLVMAEFLGILAAGVFLLARAHGAARVPSVVVALAAPFAGFTLWYEAGGWPAGLMAFTWTVHFWWSARRSVRGRLTPLVPFLFGALTMTTGNPYGALGVVVVLLGLGVELALAREWRRLLSLAVTGACVGALALLVFLPLLGVGAVTNRNTLATLGNDTFLVPGAGDLLSSSSVTYLPAITNWSGALLESVPSTYLAWFVVPLLPWLRWRVARTRLGRATASLFVVGGFYLLATLGPSNLWLFRWPVRVIEYLYLAVLVAFAVLLSAGLAVDHLRRRALASAALVAAGCYLAWAVRPASHGGWHLVGLLLVAVLVALAVLAWRRRGMRMLGAVLVVGTACVLALQTSTFPWAPDPLLPDSTQAAAPAWPPHDLSAMAAGETTYRGTVLQLASLTAVPTEQTRSGQLLFGNLPRAVLTGDRESVVSYTGMGFQDFQDALCTDYRGNFCPQAWDRLWAPAGRGVDVPLVDAMRVSTVVLQRSLRPDAADAAPPPGWHVTVRDEVRTVWVRDRPLDGSGRVSWTAPGTTVRGDDSAPEQEGVRFTAGSPGRVLFARLAWPGYSAQVDGRPVTVTRGPAGLLAVDVPAGQHDLEVRYRTPGLAVGEAAALAAVAGALVQAAVWWVGALRRRRRPEVVADDSRR
jgi:hypothetical protein